MSTWEEEVLDVKSAYEHAESQLQEARAALRELAVSVSEHSEYRLEDVAMLFGWSVSYIRSLRKTGGVSSQRTRTASYVTIPAAVRSEVRKCLSDVMRADADARSAREAYVREIRRVIEPAPTMTDVASVIGVSRQRVSQMIT